MELKVIISKRKLLLFAFILFQLANNSVTGQSWSIEYTLLGDSSVYKLTQDKVVQGKPIDFYFPAYKFNQTSSTTVIESIQVDNYNIIEVEFDSKTMSCDMMHFEVDLYAERIDSIQIFLKISNGHLIPINKLKNSKGYTYLPTIFYSIDFTHDKLSSGVKSIQIIGSSKEESSKFIIGRMNVSKKIEFTTNNKEEGYSFVSEYTFEKESDTFYELPDFYLKLHGFNWSSQLVLKDCNTTYDSIQCLSQYINKLLNEYELYDVYGINKYELIIRNTVLSKMSNDIQSYYIGLKDIIASLNSCHMRLSTSTQDEVESPFSPVYFYNINNEIAVSAIFDPTLIDKIQLGDRLVSINNFPVPQLYDALSKYIFASTPQQREIKITQKLLFMAKEIWGDSLLFEFKNNTSTYSVLLNESNFSGKKRIPTDFKVYSDNVLEKHDEIIYIKPVFQESLIIPYLYSYMTELNNSKGMILDLRGCSYGDNSFCTFLSFLISENSIIVSSDSTMLNSRSDYIIKPSMQLKLQAPIVVLVDSRTACFSELLINALRKNRADVLVIGAGNSAGSAQYTKTMLLPWKATLTYFEGISKDVNGHAIDDYNGIIPDKLINISSYKELFPYDDKLKQIALAYLKDKKK